MRIRPCLTTMVPLLLTMAMSAECSAQMMGNPSYGAPAFMGGPPPSYQGGGPGSFPSHPNISPYQNAMDQTYNSDGLWFRKILGHSMATNDYFFNISYVRTKPRNLSGRIGDENAPTFTQEETLDGTTNTNLPDALFLNNFNPAGASLTPDVIGNGIQLNWGMKSKFGWGVNVEGQWNAPSAQIYNSRQNYEQQRLQTSQALDLEASAGAGIINGYFASTFNERSLVETQILVGTTADITTAIGPTAVLGAELFGGGDDILDRQLFNLHSIPLQNGVDPDGFTQRFDLDFITEHTVESYTGAIDFSAPVIYETPNVKISPVVGGRFIGINEGWSFRGVDSGLAYLQNIPDGVDDDGDFVVDNVAETGTATFTVQNPYDDAIIRSFIDASVQSNMAGPEIGLQYTLGEGEGLTISGGTKVGAMFNTEKIRLAGDNIGDTVTSTDAVTLDDLFPTQTIDPITGQTILTENAFTDGKRSTHLSPMFQQTLMAEIPLFSRVPVLRDMWQFENATFTAGWTFLYVGEIADPQQSINYLSNPRAGVTPTINVERSTYFQNSFNAGINWSY